VFTALTGPPHVAYTRLAAPKHEVMVKEGVHVWFTDPREPGEAGRNPDCMFFDKHLPEMKLPLCQARYPLVDAERQRAITRSALVDFFDAYLKNDADARARLEALGERFSEATVLTSKP